MTSRQGGLLELVARGKKDQFFTANPSVSFFHSVYIRAAPFTKEIYSALPRNVPAFGHWVDFDIDHRGDIAKQFYLRLQLPTWLPPSIVNANASSVITDVSGVTFGYCNNIGFQILDRIQLFQDQLLIHEMYGEFIEWRLRQSYSLSSTYLLAGEVGAHGGSALEIGRNATPGLLRIPIPLLGWQRLFDPGLPLIALKSQRFRLRILLRPLESIIEASDGRMRPHPWNIPLRIQKTRDGPIDTSVISLKKTEMTPLTVALEHTVVYLPADVQQWFKIQSFAFPFVTAQSQSFTIEDNQLAAAAYSPALQLTLPFPVDFIGSSPRILVAIRSEASTLAGQRDVFVASNGAPYIRNARFNVANIDRIRLFELPVFREVTAYWKNKRMALDQNNTQMPHEVYTFSFAGMDSPHPEGTFHFTRASLPTLFLTLNNVPYDVRNKSRKAFVLVYLESWNIFSIKHGIGKILFDF